MQICLEGMEESGGHFWRSWAQEEETYIGHLTKQNANKCHDNLDRKPWKKRKNVYDSKLQTFEDTLQWMLSWRQAATWLWVYFSSYHSPVILDDIIDDNFTVEEFEVSIRKFNRSKADGIGELQPEHLKYGGSLWLKQMFWAFATFEQVPPSVLVSIIRPIYKGKVKDPHSYRGISISSVLMKVFEYKTTFQNHISCQDAIFATQEAI